MPAEQVNEGKRSWAAILRVSTHPGLTVDVGNTSKRLYGAPKVLRLPISWKLSRDFPDECIRESVRYNIHDEEGEKGDEGLRQGDQHGVFSLEALRLIKISIFFWNHRPSKRMPVAGSELVLTVRMRSRRVRIAWWSSFKTPRKNRKGKNLKSRRRYVTCPVACQGKGWFNFPKLNNLKSEFRVTAPRRRCRDSPAPPTTRHRTSALHHASNPRHSVIKAQGHVIQDPVHAQKTAICHF